MEEGMKRLLVVLMSEEQQLAIELQEFSSPQCKAPVGEFWIGKAPKVWGL